PPEPYREGRHIIRFRDTGVFQGRDKELRELENAWASNKRIITIVGIGGSGKTAIAVRWANSKVSGRNHSGVESYFAWSFYNQGLDGSSAGTTDEFFIDAFEFFGDPEAAAEKEQWRKGRRLAELVGTRRTLLILDGLETLQYPPGPRAGELRDGSMIAL